MCLGRDEDLLLVAHAAVVDFDLPLLVRTGEVSRVGGVACECTDRVLVRVVRPDEGFAEHAFHFGGRDG